MQMTKSSESSRPPIAIVGVSALFPGSLDATGFWSDILAGTDLITDVATYTIFSMICVELWCRMFIDKTTPSID